MALVKYNNNSISAVTSAASIPSGAMTLIKTLTASSSATLSFVHGSSSVVLDSTYPIYVFKFINMHPADDDAMFTFNLSIDSGSNYNVTKTTTAHRAYHTEAGAAPTLEYYPQIDLAQSTSFQPMAGEIGNANDESMSGYLHLFNPSSTTFVKHFMTNVSQNTYHNLAMNTFTAGYGNITSAVDAVQFKMDTGNLDSGTIKLYGIKDS